MSVGNLAAFSHGASVIYPNETFNAGKTLESVEKF
jgi:hypothetical protein